MGASTLIRGRYEPVAVLGRGGQGEVVRAIDRQHDREVALKIRPIFDEGDRQALLAEARILLSLRPHPNLPLVREDFFWSDRYVLAMDFIDGADLRQVLGDTGDPGLSLRTVVDWLEQAADAIGHLHSQGVVHGDVKPANLVLAPDGRIVLVDFGIARQAGEPGPAPHRHAGLRRPGAARRGHDARRRHLRAGGHGRGPAHRGAAQRRPARLGGRAPRRGHRAGAAARAGHRPGPPPPHGGRPHRTAPHPWLAPRSADRHRHLSADRRRGFDGPVGGGPRRHGRPRRPA